MNCWLDRFIQEKGIDSQTEFTIEFNGQMHYIPFEVVREFIGQLNEEMQEKVKHKLIQIDFLDGNIMLYFQYLAEGMVKANSLSL
jgi:hypothetical protein